jgi:hypothetical protein
VVCAIYAIDPSEIGFESFAASKSSLSGSDTSEKMASSQDKGFRPLAAHFEGVYSDFIIADFNPDFCMRFAGMEIEDEARAWEARKLVCTVNEIRAEEGLPEHPDEKIGSLPVNPALIGPAMMLNNPAPGTGDFGADAVVPPDPEEPGSDFGSEAPAPAPAAKPAGADKPDDFGAEAPPPPKPVAKAFSALSASALWRLGALR